jgi:hypothetical protein
MLKRMDRTSFRSTLERWGYERRKASSEAVLALLSFVSVVRDGRCQRCA